jgi:hypothetical protein
VIIKINYSFLFLTCCGRFLHTYFFFSSHPFNNESVWKNIFPHGKIHHMWGKLIFFTLALGTIQVLRHQRGGWVGWLNDDVWWQGGWVGVTKYWCDQKIYKAKNFVYVRRKPGWNFLKKNFFYAQNLLEIYLSFRGYHWSV